MVPVPLLVALTVMAVEPYMAVPEKCVTGIYWARALGPNKRRIVVCRRYLIWCNMSIGLKDTFFKNKDRSYFYYDELFESITGFCFLH
jgi:hypothetical protein